VPAWDVTGGRGGGQGGRTLPLSLGPKHALPFSAHARAYAREDRAPKHPLALRAQTRAFAREGLVQIVRRLEGSQDAEVTGASRP
jgi:hypothetical protein